jgi:hypothetical protein
VRGAGGRQTSVVGAGWVVEGRWRDHFLELLPALVGAVAQGLMPRGCVPHPTAVTDSYVAHSACEA